MEHLLDEVFNSRLWGLSRSVTTECHKRSYDCHFWNEGHLDMVLDIKVRGPMLKSFRIQSEAFG